MIILIIANVKKLYHHLALAPLWTCGPANLQTRIPLAKHNIAESMSK